MSSRWYGKFGNSQASFMNHRSRVEHFSIEEKAEMKKFLRREVKSLQFISVVDLPQNFFPKQVDARRILRSDIPMKSSYGLKLGIDRLMNIYASRFLVRSKHRVVMDCGTATCVDFATEDSYLGGWIAVGAETSLRALYDYTVQLPSLSPQRISKRFGETTEESMHIGVRNLLLGQIAEAETNAKKHFGRAKVDFVLTGGWSHLIKNLTNWRHEPLLSLLGLKKMDDDRKIEK